MTDSTERLAVYGSLAPGRHNHDQLAGLAGNWFDGYVRGRVIDVDWGTDAGYPGLILDPDGDGPEVPVWVLESAELSRHWERLDAFEGPNYERVVVEVATGRGVVSAFVYAWR